MATTTGDPTIDALYRGRKGRVDFVDVPEFGYVMIDGTGAPESGAFGDAIAALYSVSYGAHFALKKAGRAAPRVMPLEAQWWVEGDDARRVMERFAAGDETMDATERDRWRWRAMIVQLPPIDETVIDAAIAEARSKTGSKAGTASPHDPGGMEAVRYERWAEGPCAQIMHVGPYSTEQTSIVALHRAITEHGAHPRGLHHEIYLGDPRRAAPEKLRTILRQPIEPA